MCSGEASSAITPLMDCANFSATSPWKKVLRHEFHGLLVVAAGAFVFDAMQESWRARAWRVDAPWLWFVAASAVLFAIFAALKRGTRLLEG